MKRETREWLGRLAAYDSDQYDRETAETARDAIATDVEVKRLRREAKQKDEALRAAVGEFDRRNESPWHARALCAAALKPKRKR